MRLAGIIAEYNPFHRGHAHHLLETRRQGASHVVVVMSGNFVQRGEPACFPKWVRAQIALQHGADLVVELPTPFATAAAPDFAFAAVDLMKKLSIDTLSFGSECGDTTQLWSLLEACQTAEAHPAFQVALAKGLGHPTARHQTLIQLFGGSVAEAVRSPNNLLAIEYLRAMRLQAVAFDVMTVARIGTAHDAPSPQGSFASASFLRTLLKDGSLSALAPYLPEGSVPLLQEAVDKGQGPVFSQHLDRLLLSNLRMTTSTQLSCIDGMGKEGLEHRILKEMATCTSFEECVDRVSGKRYTKARVRRVLLHFLLGLQSDQFGKTADYLHVLGMNERGKEILKGLRHGDTPVSPKFADLATGSDLATFEARCTDLYGSVTPTIQPAGWAYRARIVPVENSL